MGRRPSVQFDEAVRLNMSALIAYARSVTHNSWTADEAVQETLIRAWRYWPTFRHDSQVLTWLITICRRVVIDIASRTVAHEQIAEEVLAIPESHSEIGVNELIADLPLPQREVLVLCLVIGFDYDTTASILDIPIGTVRSRLSRARDALAVQMANEKRDAV